MKTEVLWQAATLLYQLAEGAWNNKQGQAWQKVQCFLDIYENIFV